MAVLMFCDWVCRHLGDQQPAVSVRQVELIRPYYIFNFFKKIYIFIVPGYLYR